MTDPKLSAIADTEKLLLEALKSYTFFTDEHPSAARATHALHRGVIDALSTLKAESVCPNCEAAGVTETTEQKTIELFGESAAFPVQMGKCGSCEFSWLDYRAEDAEMRAAYDLLCRKVKALQNEVDSLREFKRSVDTAPTSGDGTHRP